MVTIVKTVKVRIRIETGSFYRIRWLYTDAKGRDPGRAMMSSEVYSRCS